MFLSLSLVAPHRLGTGAFSDTGDTTHCGGTGVACHVSIDAPLLICVPLCPFLSFFLQN